MISFTGAQVIRTKSREHYHTLKSYSLNATEPTFHFEPQSVLGPKSNKVYTGIILTGEEKAKVMSFREQVRMRGRSQDFMKIVDCFEEYMMKIRGKTIELKKLEDLNKISFLENLNLSHIGIFKNIGKRR